VRQLLQSQALPAKPELKGAEYKIGTLSRQHSKKTAAETDTQKDGKDATEETDKQTQDGKYATEETDKHTQDGKDATEETDKQTQDGKDTADETEKPTQDGKDAADKTDIPALDSKYAGAEIRKHARHSKTPRLETRSLSLNDASSTMDTENAMLDESLSTNMSTDSTPSPPWRNLKHPFIHNETINDQLPTPDSSRVFEIWATSPPELIVPGLSSNFDSLQGHLAAPAPTVSLQFNTQLTPLATPRSMDSNIPPSNRNGAVSSLQPGQWLSSTAIEMVLDIFSVSSSILILDPGYIAAASAQGPVKRVLLTSAHSLILIPLHHSAKSSPHWTLAVLDLGKQDIQHFDSLRRDYSMDANERLRAFTKHLDEQFPTRFENKTWTFSRKV